VSGAAELKLALRWLVRSRRRSAGATLAIVCGVVALLLAGGFIQWIFADMRESTIRSRIGHVQLLHRGAVEGGPSDPFRHLLPVQAGRLQALAADPRVDLIGQRLAFSGLVSHGDTSLGFIGEGVEPDKELALSRALQIVRGENLAADDPRGLVIGQGLAANLGVKVGDTVVLLANSASGGINAVECRIRGIFTTISKLFDDSALRLPIESARALLKVDGSHSWVVLLKDTAATGEVVDRMRAAYPTGEVRIVAWTELADFYNKTVTLFSRQIGILQVIVAMIIVLSITNTMLMSVVERTGEVGTALALGVPRWRVVSQFVLEGFLLGLFGAAAGLLLGLAAAWGISAIGIPMPPPPGMARGYLAQILVTPSLAVNAVLIAIVASVLASLYPAWKVSRLPIVDALRHNR
jgi:putative ABC transport system permease protein